MLCLTGIYLLMIFHDQTTSLYCFTLYGPDYEFLIHGGEHQTMLAAPLILVEFLV